VVRRTLLPAGLLDLGRHAVPHKPVMGFKLLHGLGAVVDEREAGALASTKVCLVAKNRDIVLLGLVKLAELATEFILGDVGSVRMEDVTGRPLASLSAIVPPHLKSVPALTRPSDGDRGGGCE
jgi:hypothetical protein